MTIFQFIKDKKQTKFHIKIAIQDRFFNYNPYSIKNQKMQLQICYQTTVMGREQGLEFNIISRFKKFGQQVGEYHELIRQSGILPLKLISAGKFRQIPKNESKTLNEYSLRGGGCGTSKLEKRPHQEESLSFRELPRQFIQDLEKYLNIIISKAQLASDYQQREEIMIAIQWFTLMREHINTLCVDSQSAASVYDLIFSNVPNLLKSTITYLRISGFLCIQILQIINDLFRILFTFFMKNDKRFLKVEVKEYLDGLISDFETHLNIEDSNIWTAGAEFEITMIKAVIQSSPSNSDEGKKLLAQFLGDLVQSVLKMSPTNDLVDSLIGGAKFLYYAHQVEDLKKKYEVYYYFESLKWYMIQLLREDVSSQRVIQLLKSAFMNYIDNQNDWLMNFCWVKFIASLISYRPIISKQELPIKKVEQQQRWNQLIKLKYLSPVSFNKDLGLLFFYQNNQNSETQVVNQLLQKFGFKSFQLFNDLLLNSLEYSSINQFSFKDIGRSEQIKIDYLNDVIFGNFQQEKSIEQLNYLVIGYEQLFQQLKKGYEKYQAVIKNEKENQLQIKDVKESIKQLIQQAFCIFNHCSNINKNFVLYFERFQIILDSAIIQNSDKERFKQLLQLEQGFIEKCNKVLVELLNERNKLIISITTLEINFENDGIITEQQFKNIQKQFEYIESFTKYPIILKEQYLKILGQINQNKISNSKSKKNSIYEYKQEGSLKIFEQLFSKIINQNNLESQIIIIDKLFQDVSKEKDWSNKLIIYNSLRYFLPDFVNQMSLQKEQLEEIIKFIQINLSSLQLIESVSIDFVNLMLKKQRKIFKEFFSPKEKQLTSENKKDSISGEQILQLLKKDSEKLQKLQPQQNNEFNLKQIVYAVEMVGKFFDKYLRNQQELSQIQEQISKIYSLLIPNQNEDVEEQAIQPQSEKQSENLSLSKNIENLQNRLISLTNTITSTLPKCQIILKKIVDQIILFEDIKFIYKKLDCKEQKQMLLSLAFEANDNQNLLEHKTFLQEIQKELNNQIIEFNESVSQKQLYAGLFQIQLNFCDLIRPNFSKSLNIDQNFFQKAQTFFQEFINDVKEGLEDQNYKARQCYAISLISFQSSSQEQNIIKFCQDSILQIWAFEKDERVKALLKNKELQEMQKSLFSSDLKSFSKRLSADMNERFRKIADLEQKIYLEGDFEVRQQMHEELLQEQQEFEDYLDNVNDMAGKLDIGIQFLKDIKNNLTELKQKIDKLQDAVNNIGDDIRKLRGKNFDELLNIRKRKVLEQMQLDSLYKIYIPLTCQEWDPISGQKVGQPSILLHSNFQNQDGEINEFLQKDSSKKDVLLLRGIAGSGKSKAAGKIEEFLWQKIDSKESSWIPIYVSLPTLKEPKFNLLDQALESDFYQFDKIQVKEFKDALAQKGLKIILILDSYDEMKQECIQSNLYQTNRFQKDLFGNLQESKQVKEQLKVIITTRTEVLTSKRYQTWFYGETLESLKEVELLGFDKDQQHRYLDEYTKLTLKKEVLELYSFNKQMTKQRIDVQEFCSFWKKISDYLMNNLSSYENQLIDEIQARQLISILKLEKSFQNVQKEQIVNLQKTMMELWGTSKFKNLIDNAQIQHILTTPFMMEIVVQVLPTMAKSLSGEFSFKEKFINNYVKIKLESQEEQKTIIQQENKRLRIEGKQEKPQQKVFTENEFQMSGLIIWDQLQNEKCLQKFSLVDKIQKKDLQKIDDSAIVIRALMFKKLTAFDFYSTFVEFYHSKQIKKLSLLGRMINYESLMTDLFNFSQSLAINLTINQLTQIKYIQKGQLILQFVESENNQEEDWIDAYFNDFTANGEYKKLIRSCILIATKGYYYSFTHKSIQEFYVGHFLLKMLDELKIMKEEEFKNQLSTINWENTQTKLKQKQENQACLTSLEQFFQLISNSLLNQNKFNLSSDNYKGVLSIIREEIKQNSNLKPKLLQILKLSSISQELIRASSNSLFLLGYNNDLLAEQQLQNLRISDIDLDGVSFYSSNLSKSVFKDVSIRSCNFNNVNLSDSKWTGIKCDELHGLVGHQNIIDYIQFSHDGKNLISVSNGDESLRFWNILECKVTQEFTFSSFQELNYFHGQTNEFKIQKAIFSKNDQYLGLLWDFQNAGRIVQIIDINSRNSKGFSNEPNFEVYEMKFTYDNTTLAIRNNSRIITLLSLSDNKQYKLSGHSKKVNSILFTEDDKILISCSDDQSIIYWNYKKQKIIKQYQAHNSSVNTIALSPKSHYLASCSQGIIKLWNIETQELSFEFKEQGEQIQQLKFLSHEQTLISWGRNTMILVWSIKDRKQIRRIEQQPDCICFSSDDKLLALKCQNEIQVWEIKVGKLISCIGGQSKKVLQMFFQPDFLILASLSEGENVIRLWNANIQKNTSQLEGHQQKVKFIEISPDNKIISSASTDGTIRLWDVKEGKHLQYVSNIQGLKGIKFSKKGEFIFIEADNSQLWYFKEGRQVKLKQEDINEINEIAITCFTIHPERPIIGYSSFLSQKQESKIYLYDLKEKKDKEILSVSSKIKNLMISPKGQLLASLSENGNAHLWDMKSYSPIAKLDKIIEIIFSPTNQIILVKNENKIDYQFLNYKGVQIGLIQNQCNMIFSPNNSILASTFEKTLFIWNSSDGKEIAKFDDHQEDIKEICFSPDGSILAIRCWNEKFIDIWDITNLKFFKKLELEICNYLIAFSRNTNILAISDWNQIHIWNYKVDAQIATLQEVEISQIKFLLFSPDDQILFSQSKNLDFVIRNTNTWEIITSYKNQYSIERVKFSSDSQRIFVSDDVSIQILNSTESYEPKQLLGHQNKLTQIEFLSDCSQLVSLDEKGNFLAFWDCEKYKIAYTHGQNLKKKQLILSNDDKNIASHVGDIKIRLYETENVDKIFTLLGHKHLILQISFSPDSCYLASCSLDHTIILWDVKDKKQYAILEEHQQFVIEIAFSPDSCLLSSICKKTCRVWEIKSLEQKSETTIYGEDLSKTNILFSLDNRQLVLFTKKILYIWNFIESTKLVFLKDYSYNICFSPEGNLCVFYDDGHNIPKINIWDLKQQKIQNEMETEKYNNLQFNLEGNLIFFLCKKNQVLIFDIKKNKKITSIQEHTNNINQIKLSADNKLLASCSDDNTIKLFQIDENIQEYQSQANDQINIGNLLSYKTLALYSPITANKCKIQRAEIYSKIGWSLKQLFIQKGANEK